MHTEAPKIELSLRDEILHMLHDGVSMPDIVRIMNETFPDLGLTYGTVYHLYRGSDAVVLKRDITHVRAFIGDRPRRDVVMELYDRGVKPKAIASRLGVDYKYVTNDIYDAKQKRIADQFQALKRLPESPKLRAGPTS